MNMNIYLNNDTYHKLERYLKNNNISRSQLIAQALDSYLNKENVDAWPQGLFDFKEEEKTMILEAIINHRDCESNDLNAIIYKSDKLSRACYKCKAAKGCNWPLEKRNLEIKY